MLKGYVHVATFILAVVGLVGCAGRFDYNLLLALGWIYLADKHPYFCYSFAFYLLVLGSVLVDAITMISSSDQDDKFTFVFMPLLQMGIKLVIFGFSIYYDKKGREQRQKMQGQ